MAFVWQIESVGCALSGVGVVSKAVAGLRSLQPALLPPGVCVSLAPRATPAQDESPSAPQGQAFLLVVSLTPAPTSLPPWP